MIADTSIEMAAELFFEIRRDRTHYYLDIEENKIVRDLKQMLVGITHHPVETLELWKLDEEGRKQQVLHDSAVLSECGFSVLNAKAQSPAPIGLRVTSVEDHLTIIDVSTPPPIPDTMRQEPAAEN